MDNQLKIALSIAYAQAMLKHALDTNSVPRPETPFEPYVSKEIEFFYSEFNHALDELENYRDPEALSENNF